VDRRRNKNVKESPKRAADLLTNFEGKYGGKVIGNFIHLENMMEYWY
jgi:hypothetical protein